MSEINEINEINKNKVEKYTLPENLKTLNWEDALLQVCGDYDFLKEVLYDLIEEMKNAEDTITNGIGIKDFVSITRAAHRIKGSAAYLYCEKMHDISLKLQNFTNNIDNDVSDYMVNEVIYLFEIFCSCKEELMNEIKNKLENLHHH